MLKQLELSDAALARLAQHAQEIGIDVLATPFSIEDIPRVLALNPPAVKIASTDLNNRPILEAVAETNKPMILSTGASTIEEIDQAVADLTAANALERLTLLHCVSRYPTPVGEANLAAIAKLIQRYHIPVGFSDHTTEESTGAYAVAAGATMLEKHFTLDRSQSGPDHQMSLMPDELQRYITAAREAADAVGIGRLGMNRNETEIREMARKSITTKRRLKRGETISEEMLTLKRPGTGIPPTEWNLIIGRQANVPIPSDTTITWEMIK
jgi:sialic acid synthase SpsE